MSRLKFGDALRGGIWIEQVMGVIREDEIFKYTPVDIKIIENRDDKSFTILYSHNTQKNKKLKEWIEYQTIHPDSDTEAKKLREMKRNYKHLFGRVVEFPLNGEQQVRVYYVYSSNSSLVDTQLDIATSEDFFEYKGLMTANAVSNYVQSKMDENERLYQFKVDIGMIKPKM